MAITKITSQPFPPPPSPPYSSTTPALLDAVNSLIDTNVVGIKSLPANPHTDTVYGVIGFYSGSSVGGGNFIWSPSTSKSSHNGGTVIAPEAISAWDGTKAGLSSLLNWSGSGDGCWVRICNISTPEYFGANQSGDDTLPIQKSNDAAYLWDIPLCFKTRAIYSASELFISAKTVMLNGCTLLKNSATSQGFFNYGKKPEGIVGGFISGDGATIDAGSVNNVINLRLYGSHSNLTIKDINLTNSDFYALTVGALSPADNSDTFTNVTLDNIRITSERGNSLLTTQYSFGFEIYPKVVCTNFKVSNCSTFGKILNKFQNIKGLYFSNVNFVPSTSFDTLASGLCEINNCQDVQGSLNSDGFDDTYFSLVVGKIGTVLQTIEDINITGNFRRVGVRSGSITLSDCVCRDLSVYGDTASLTINGGVYRNLRDETGATVGKVSVTGARLTGNARFDNGNATGKIIISSCTIDSTNDFRFDGKAVISGNSFELGSSPQTFVIWSKGATADVVANNNSFNGNALWVGPLFVSSGGKMRAAGNRFTGFTNTNLLAAGSQALLEDINNTVNGVNHT